MISKVEVKGNIWFWRFNLSLVCLKLRETLIKPTIINKAFYQALSREYKE